MYIIYLYNSGERKKLYVYHFYVAYLYTCTYIQVSKMCSSFRRTVLTLSHIHRLMDTRPSPQKISLRGIIQFHTSITKCSLFSLFISHFCLSTHWKLYSGFPIFIYFVYPFNSDRRLNLKKVTHKQVLKPNR